MTGTPRYYRAYDKYAVQTTPRPLFNLDAGCKVITAQETSGLLVVLLITQASLPLAR